MQPPWVPRHASAKRRIFSPPVPGAGDPASPPVRSPRVRLSLRFVKFGDDFDHARTRLVGNDVDEAHEHVQRVQPGLEEHPQNGHDDLLLMTSRE